MSAPMVEDSVAVIGPGRVGTALALALREAGCRMVAVAGRGPAAIERFRSVVPTAAPVSVEDAARAAALVLLTVNDDELPGVARHLAGADAVTTGSRWVHTSGRHGVAVLRPVMLAGGRVAACHPAQTFPAPDVAAADLDGCAWAVTAAAHDRVWAHELVRRLNGDPVDVDEAARVRYHAGLAVGSNGTAAVVSLARDLLLAAGIGTPERFLTHLVTRSAGTAAEHGAAALTGPVRRGDTATVRAHLDDLRTVLPEAIPAYRALAELALAYARRAGLDAHRAQAVARILDDMEP
ncbi:MAG TPA: Rossmann-like and DUF2520 domain-containing protein [Euzebyales bacterium]|nr:Rossmann-like and DUF2520 domain-containing protein [Euzebyales bacterium]